MLETIIKTYEALNAELLITTPFNDNVTRDLIKINLERELPNCNIKCDEENNPPEIIDECVAVATINWLSENGIQTIDLVFGTPEQVIKVQMGSK